MRPRFASNVLALRKQRAQGIPGARCTRGPVSNVHKKHAHEHTGSAEAIRHSLRSGFTLIPCSPRRSGLGLSPSPALLDANLTPALRRQDHTYSPYASAPSRLSAHPRPPLPRPALLTLRNAPLSGTGCKSYSAIQVSEKQKYFCKEGWTIRISGANEVEVICPSGSHTGITLPDPIRRRRPCRPPNKNGAARPRRSQ
jgi:hypothetical protein